MADDKDVKDAAPEDGGPKRYKLWMSIFIIGILLLALPLIHVLKSASERENLTELVVSSDVTPPTTIERLLQLDEDTSRLENDPRRKRLLKEELNLLLTQMRVRKEQIADEEITWIFDGTTPEGFSSNVFYVYIGRRAGYTWGRVMVGCALDQPMTIRRMGLDIDTTLYAVDIEYNDLRTQYIDYLDLTFEYADLSILEHLDIMRHAANAEDIIAALVGAQGEHSFKLNYDQVAAVKRVMRVYSIYKELETLQ